MQKTQAKTNTKEFILETVNEFVDYIKPTYGPAENGIIIDHPYSTQFVDDGVTIAREYKSDDENKNAIIKFIRKVAENTNSKVGDGTTSSLILLQGLMQEIAKSSKQPIEIVRELKTGLEEAKIALKKQSKRIKGLNDLEKIAKISFNDDKISKLIAKLVYELGPDASILTEDSGTSETTGEKAKGFEFNMGYIAPWMVNNAKMESEIKDPLILVTNYRIANAPDLLPLLEEMAKAKKFNLVIVAERTEGDGLNMLAQNSKTVLVRDQNGERVGLFNILAVNIPDGDKTEFVNDLALLTGAVPLTIDRGQDFTKISLSMLGKCSKVVATNKKTLFFDPKGKKGIKEAISTLKEQLKKTKNAFEKDQIEQRLAKFSGKVAVIKAGAPTENELKALKYKIEDSVNAVKVAYSGGIVCGAGLALARIRTSSPILTRALAYPFNQLRENSGLQVELQDLKKNQAINAVTGKIGEYHKLGIIDPVEVLIAGLESAVSIVSLLIRNKGVIYEVQDDK